MGEDAMLWLIFAWIAGTAAILGSLMTLGSLILFVTPAPMRSRKPQQSHPWSQHLKLLAVSVAVALTGLGILIVVPFPTA